MQNVMERGSIDAYIIHMHMQIGVSNISPRVCTLVLFICPGGVRARALIYRTSIVYM